MHESADFLESLQHDNPNRPQFTIKPAEFDTMLEIQYLGQRMEVPISDVLHFAARWQADRQKQESEGPIPRLRRHPYPLYDTQLDNADLSEWCVPDS